MYATEAQIGKVLRCPDCHSETEVKVPKVVAPPPKKPTFDELDEFQLSEPGERPTYKPFIEAKGEYAELQLLDTKAPPKKTDAPLPVAPPHADAPLIDDPLVAEAKIPAALAVESSQHAHTAIAHVEEDLDDQEVILSAPVERIEVKTEVQVPKLPPAKKEERKEPAWNDAEWGFVADRREKDAWKKSPFYIGIFGVFADPHLLIRFVAYSVGLTVVLSFFSNAAIFANPESGQLAAGMFSILGFGVTAALWTLFFSPCLLAIATDTANGEDQVKAWPDWNVTEWLLPALYIPIAGTLALIPGLILGSMFLAVGEGAQWFAPFPPLVTFLAIFPILFSSMLTEGSLFYLISGSVLKSFSSHGEGWIVFYVCSFFFFMVAAFGAALTEMGIQAGGGGLVAASALAAVLLVTLLILYFRLLGRLVWYTQNVAKKVGNE